MPKNTRISFALLVAATLPFHNASHATSMIQPSTEQVAEPQTKQRAFFANLKNNDKVSRTFTVKFGVEGMKIAPVGISKSNAGHFHLFIDSPPLTEDQFNSSIPVDSKRLSFGAGQTEVNLTLPIGEHTLQLLMGNGAGKPHNPPIMSDVITITVE